MRDGNTSRKYIVPAFYWVVWSRQISDDTIVDIPQFMIKLLFFCATPENKDICIDPGEREQLRI
jgi:hypothetical protein